MSDRRLWVIEIRDPGDGPDAEWSPRDLARRHWGDAEKDAQRWDREGFETRIRSYTPEEGD